MPPTPPITLTTPKPTITRKSFRKYSYLFFPVITLAFVALSLPLFIIPQVNSLLKTRSEINTLKAKETKLATKLTQLKALPKEDLTKNVKILSLAYPPEKAIGEALLGLTALAGKNELKITSFKLTPGLISTDSAKAKTDVSDNVLIDISIEGDSQNLENFLGQTTHLLPLITLGTVDLKYPNKLTLKANSLWAPLPSQLPTLDASLPLITEADQKTLNLVKTFYDENPPIDVQNINLPVGKPNPFVP